MPRSRRNPRDEAHFCAKSRFHRKNYKVASWALDVIPARNIGPFLTQVSLANHWRKLCSLANVSFDKAEYNLTQSTGMGKNKKN